MIIFENRSAKIFVTDFQQYICWVYSGQSLGFRNQEPKVCISNRNSKKFPVISGKLKYYIQKQTGILWVHHKISPKVIYYKEHNNAIDKEGKSRFFACNTTIPMYVNHLHLARGIRFGTVFG